MNLHPFRGQQEARLICNLQTGAPITPYLKISNYVDDVVADWAPDSFFINANDRIAYTKYLKYKYKYLKLKKSLL